MLLDAAGCDIVLIETVGVGQDEVDIVRTADVSVVTLVPGTGDEVQAIKAGVMEIADVFLVNKADREGADRTAASVEAMLALQSFDEGQWRPPVLRTEANTGKGVAELWRRRRALPRRTRRRRRASGGARGPSSSSASCSGHRFLRFVEQQRARGQANSTPCSTASRPARSITTRPCEADDGAGHRTGGTRRTRDEARPPVGSGRGADQRAGATSEADRPTAVGRWAESPEGVR